VTTPTPAELRAFAAALARANAIIAAARVEAATWGPGLQWDQLRAHLAPDASAAVVYALRLAAAMEGGE